MYCKTYVKIFRFRTVIDKFFIQLGRSIIKGVVSNNKMEITKIVIKKRYILLIFIGQGVFPKS